MYDLSIERGDTFAVAKDLDGYPAVRIRNRVWVQEDRWIAVSAMDYDQEQNVRDLAAALVKLADRMARDRRKDACRAE
jgi:hypothetical protein